MRWLLFILLFSFTGYAQVSTLFIVGNHTRVCVPDDLAETIVRVDGIPDTLKSSDVIFLFSGASSGLSPENMEQLLHFLNAGGGMYCGSENWPLQTESNQLTRAFYQKESFGSYHTDAAEVIANTGNLSLDTLEHIPAGTSTVAFPLDHRLRVEAWVNDQPLILSGEIGAGNIILDGGYSRFYCDQRNSTTDELFTIFLRFLSNKTTAVQEASSPHR